MGILQDFGAGASDEGLCEKSHRRCVIVTHPRATASKHFGSLDPRDLHLQWA